MGNGFFSSLLIAGAIQGFAFNIFTISKQKKVSKVILYLNLTVFFLSLNNLQAWLIDKGYSVQNYFIQQFEVAWYLLLFPMFHMFLLHYLKVKNRGNRVLPFFLSVFVIELIVRSAFIIHSYFFTDNFDQSFIQVYERVEEVFNAVIGIGIITKSAYLVFQQKELYTFITDYDDIYWIKIFLKLGGLVLMFWVFAIFINNITGKNWAYLPLRLGTSVLLYWIGYQGFFRYRIVKDRISLRNHLIKEGHEKSSILERKKSPLTKHEKDFDKIHNYISDKQRFLDPKLTMNTLADELKMSPSHFSKIINGHSSSNFSDYINSFRVEQAKKLLSDNHFGNYTIASIGLECGFNSKSTFYSAFKKMTSITPTEFRKVN
ncbi:AraC-type DNA-binding protein [Tenacibaculum sp. MAR_2009_124]|uniref:helix-turn-helix domain-containing protein n=1 Tax=Tenacibaculum sp. MAR_2009_124 TaxID=1250059 RepID=UPI0008982919|nr:AraC family transcriptional regulator [Tenacibaculum sp. MAR_2009_124]SED15448.1 AraC-type DNA-binding protein [Tenacibaculum sp. MAR_2009_124]